MMVCITLNYLMEEIHSTLTADEISGLKLDYDISNYASLSDSERTTYFYLTLIITILIYHH